MSLSGVSIVVSILALTVSVLTAWFTLLRRGSLYMTRPSFVGFVWESGGEPKIFFRSFLYATGKRGYVVEALYLDIKRDHAEYVFSFWTVRQEGRMAIGGGLKVGEDGVSADFHFLPPKDAHDFEFSAGRYDIAVYAGIAGRTTPILLYKFSLSLSEQQAGAMGPNMVNSIFFTWQPERGSYHSYIAEPPTTL
jgi:hypothetical protein